VRRLVVALVLPLALATAPAALAGEQHPTLAEVEGEVMCPTCHTTLDQSSSPVAERMRVFIRARIAAGDTKSGIERKLVAQFGPAILAAPPHKGFGLLAWWLPIAGLPAGLGAVTVAVWHWSRSREPAGPAPPPAALEPELERRVDEELARLDA
jgi:cytochrome c-type biogenesis protein CcmH/NrfF